MASSIYPTSGTYSIGTTWSGTIADNDHRVGDGGWTWTDAVPGELVPYPQYPPSQVDQILGFQKIKNQIISELAEKKIGASRDGDKEAKMQVFEYILVSKDDDGELVAVEDHGFVVANSREAAAYQVGQVAAKKNTELELEPMVRPFRS